MAPASKASPKTKRQKQAVRQFPILCPAYVFLFFAVAVTAWCRPDELSSVCGYASAALVGIVCAAMGVKLPNFPWGNKKAG